MKKANVSQVLISFSAIFGIALLWYDFNMKVFHTVRDLLSATLFDKEIEPISSNKKEVIFLQPDKQEEYHNWDELPFKHS